MTAPITTRGALNLTKSAKSMLDGLKTRKKQAPRILTIEQKISDLRRTPKKDRERLHRFFKNTGNTMDPKFFLHLKKFVQLPIKNRKKSVKNRKVGEIF